MGTPTEYRVGVPRKKTEGARKELASAARFISHLSKLRSTLLPPSSKVPL